MCALCPTRIAPRADYCTFILPANCRRAYDCNVFTSYAVAPRTLITASNTVKARACSCLRIKVNEN